MSIAAVSWDALHVCVLGLCGALAGLFNAAAGGGSLLTFPALVALGLPPLTANLSNTVAQCPGNMAIAHAYRSDFSLRSAMVRRLLPPVLGGAGVGITLLEAGSESAFRTFAPVLVLLACLLLAVQDRVRRTLRVESGKHGTALGLHASVMFVCTYCGYFGAAAGVMMLAVLGSYLLDDLQRLNALSRLTILTVNCLAAVVFILTGPIDWTSVAVIAPTTVIGGRTGAGIVRRMDARRLRTAIVVVGTISSAYLIATTW